MNHDGGADKVRADPVGFARMQWDSWSPGGWYEEAAFARTARSFRNPDWAAITLHGYRSRWLPELVDRRYDRTARIIADTARLRVPTLMIQGAQDACDPPAESAGDAVWFDGPYERLVLPGVGHFPAREAAARTADAILRFRSEHAGS